MGRGRTVSVMLERWETSLALSEARGVPDSHSNAYSATCMQG